MSDATRDRRRREEESEASQTSLAILLGGGLLAVVLVGFLIVQAYGAIARLFQGDTGPTLEPEQPIVYLDRPSTEIPTPETNAEGAASETTAPGELSPAIAQVAVENWLTAKSKAMGEGYEIAALDAVLVDPLLNKWRGRVRSTQSSNEYWTYEHEVEIADVTLSPEAPGRATVVANVREAAKLYQGDRPSDSGSYDDQLRIRYTLVQVEGQWLISDGKVL